MTGIHPFSPERLRSGLELLNLAALPETTPPEWSNYLRFYDLDVAGEIPGLAHRVGYLDCGEHRLAVQLFEPEQPRATAFVCHGYYDHVGLYGHLIRYLLKRDLAVVAFDQPGHGLSSGQPATIADFAVYVQALECCLDTFTDRVPEPWHILGQSMGGSVVLEYLTQPASLARRSFNEIVLFAPLIRPALWSINRIFFEIVKKFTDERPRTFTNNANNPEFLTLIRADPMQARVLPVQWVVAMTVWMKGFEKNQHLPDNLKIIQGHMDRTVSWRYNLKVLGRMCDPHILHLPEARHHLVNEAETLRQQMWQWLDHTCRWS